jgi:hypothetical protein
VRSVSRRGSVHHPIPFLSLQQQGRLARPASSAGRPSSALLRPRLSARTFGDRSSDTGSRPAHTAAGSSKGADEHNAGHGHGGGGGSDSTPSDDDEVEDIEGQDDVMWCFRISNHPALPYSSFFIFSGDNRLRLMLLHIVTSKVFEGLVILHIIANCVTLAIDDPTAAEEDWSVKCNYYFTAAFTIEMIFKMIALGLVFHKHAYLRGGWNRLDFVIVGLSYLAMVPGFGNYSGLRAFRVLRPLRSMNAIPPLRQIVTVLLRSLSGLVDVMLLIAFLFSIFGVFAVQLFMGMLRQRCQDDSTGVISDTMFCSITDTYGSVLGVYCPSGYTCVVAATNPRGGYINYDNVLWAWLVIIQVLTLEDWSSLMYMLMTTYSYFAALYFVILVVIGAYLVLNLALAVISAEFEFAQEELDEIEQQAAEQKALEEQIASGEAAVRRARSQTRLLTAPEGISPHNPAMAVSRPTFRVTAQQIAVIDIEGQFTTSVEDTADNMPEAPGSPGGGQLSHSANGFLAAPSPGSRHSHSTSTSATNLALQLNNHLHGYQLPQHGSQATFASHNSMVPEAPHDSMGGESSPDGVSRNATHSNLNSTAGNHGNRLASSTTSSSHNHRQQQPAHGGAQALPANSSVEHSHSGPAHGSPRGMFLETGFANSPSNSARGSSHGARPLLMPARSELVPMNARLGDLNTPSEQALDATINGGGSKMLSARPTFHIDDALSDNSDAKEEDARLEKERQISLASSAFERFRINLYWFVEGDPEKTENERGLTYFGRFVILCIFLNTAVLAADHYGASQMQKDLSRVANYTFAGIFGLEMLLKLLVLTPLGYAKEMINVFDGFIVIISFVEIGLGGTSQFSVLRAFRLLRVFKLLKSFPSLLAIVEVIVFAVRDTAYLNILLFLYLFIASLFGMQFFGGTFPDHDIYGTEIRSRFDNFILSFFSVFQIMTRDDWPGLMHVAMASTSEIAFAYFVICVVTGDLIILNLFLSVIISSFEKVGKVQEERRLLELEMEEAKADKLREARRPAAVTLADGLEGRITTVQDLQLGAQSTLQRRDLETVLEVGRTVNNVLFHSGHVLNDEVVATVQQRERELRQTRSPLSPDGNNNNTNNGPTSPPAAFTNLSPRTTARTTTSRPTNNASSPSTTPPFATMPPGPRHPNRSGGLLDDADGDLPFEDSQDESGHAARVTISVAAAAGRTRRRSYSPTSPRARTAANTRAPKAATTSPSRCSAST